MGTSPDVVIRRVESSKPWASDMNRLLDVVLGNSGGQIYQKDDGGLTYDPLTGQWSAVATEYARSVRSAAGLHDRVRKSDDSLNVWTVKDAGATLIGGLSATGAVSIVGTLATSGSGNTTIGGTLGVTGATTLSSTLGVTGAATLSSTLGVTGATTLSSTLAVTGATTLKGNLTFDGSALRITGPFSDGTPSNRPSIQSSTASGATLVGVIPGSGGSQAGLIAYNNATHASASAAATLQAVAAAVELRADSPSGSYQPIDFYTSATKNASLTAAGAFTTSTLIAGGVGSTMSGSEKLRVVGTSRMEGQLVVTTGGASLTGGTSLTGGFTVDAGSAAWVNITNASTTTTAPGAGGAGALPATPLGYLKFAIGGTDIKIPYYLW